MLVDDQLRGGSQEGIGLAGVKTQLIEGISSFMQNYFIVLVELVVN
ncbi:UNVERIFIED_CONTAM: hypothetical protein Cloal_4056 [Acetivibrio alkalicellulosi]